MATDDFVKSITSDDIATIVTKHFDDLMVLYHVVGSRQDVDICTDNSKMPISFVLLMESESEAIKLTETLNGTYFSVYGVPYDISMTRNEASITTMIKKSS